MGFIVGFFGAFLVVGGLTNEPFDTQHQWGVAVGAVMVLAGLIVNALSGGGD